MVFSVLHQQRAFSSSSTQVDVTSKIKGKTSLSELKDFRNRKEQEESLQGLGLSESETQLYLEMTGSGPVSFLF